MPDMAARHSSLTVRSCLIATLLVFVVLPVAGIMFAVWLALTPTASESAVAKAYTNAPVCSTSAAGDCIEVEQAEVVDVFSTAGRCGSRTDTFKLRLADGVHLTDIYFDCFAQRVAYAPVGGRIRVREFRGKVTTVYAADGKGYETGDSPIGGSSWRGGVMALLLILCLPLLLIGLIVVGASGSSIWRTLKDPTRPLPSYSDAKETR